MLRYFFASLLFLILFINQACTSKVKEAEVVPENYVNKEAEIHLGQLLFFEPRLSSDNSTGCVSCHLPGLAFTDGLEKSVGVEGRMAARNSPTLFNLADHSVFMFDGVIPSLELQALAPISDHNEMNSSMKEIIEKLKDDPVFKRQVKKAYKRPLDPKAITHALAAYQRTLVSKSSRFDAFLAGNKSRISKEEKEGWFLFQEKFQCTSCHALPNLTSAKTAANGLPINDGDFGRYRATNKESDKGHFKIPTLRNISLTAPYMHDGRFATLEDVLNFYATAPKSEYAPIMVQKYKMSSAEQKKIISFLHTLQDTVLF